MHILDELKHLYDSRIEEIDNWLKFQREKTPPYVYTSVDLRHSGERLVPVDVNLFPAGFNNLSPAAAKRAVDYFRNYFTRHYPGAKQLVVVAESHTRNLAYLHNLFVLQNLLTDAGMEVRIGSLMAEAGKPLTMTTSLNATITQYALAKSGSELLADGFKPDVILLNNDMTAGVPEILQGVKQPILPPPEVGWHRRRKSVHFSAYKHIAESFGQAFSVDPWLISANFHSCGMIDFKAREGLDCLADSIERLMAGTRKKYQEYGISQEPYVFVKADSGTYGMGVMTVHSAKDILEMNKKERNKMHTIKEGKEVSEVIIQEGIPTVDKVNGYPAEPLVYLVGGCAAGGMYRSNPNRTALNNLNMSGMEFTGMCDQDEQLADKLKIKNCDVRSYGLIASLSALAAVREKIDSAVGECREKHNAHS